MTDEAGRWITYNGEIYNYPELRQELADELPDQLRHRGRPRAPTTAGASTRCSTCAACSPTRSGTSRAGAVLRPGSLRDQALLLHGRRRRPLLRLRGQGAAAVPARDRDGPGRVQGLSGLPVLPRRQDPLQGGPRAPARAPAASRSAARSRRSATGRSTTSSTSTTPGSYFEERCEQLWRSRCAAPAQRRARRRVSQRRARLERRRLPCQRGAAGRPDGVHRQVLRGPALRRDRYARALARSAVFDLHEIDIGVERLRRAHRATSSTIWTTRRPGRARSRSTWSRVPAAQHVKVVLGGQGGDEIFGGYARYLIAYFEQCIKGPSTARCRRQLRRHVRVHHPEPASLRNYKPMMQEFWREGLFEDMDAPLLPPGQPLARSRATSRLATRSATTRHSRPSGRSSTGQRRPRSPTSTR